MSYELSSSPDLLLTFFSLFEFSFFFFFNVLLVKLDIRDQLFGF